MYTDEFSAYDCIKSEQWKLSSRESFVFMIVMFMSIFQKDIDQYAQCQAVNGKLEACWSPKKPREPPLV